MKIQNLQINHLTKPVGIDGKHLRLSWTLTGCERQSAYRVTVTETASAAVFFDSGWIEGRNMYYRLPTALSYHMEADITLQTKDETGALAEPETLRVVTGLSPELWRARWIDPERQREKAASYLRKRFSLASKPRPYSAFLYATAHGIFHVWINGMEITDHELMPGTNQVNNRLMVECLPVSDFLREGENEILVSLGDGWYRGSMGYNQTKNVFGTDLAFLAQLEIDRLPVLHTDEAWEATQNGPVRENDLMAGEVYDARLETLTGFHPVAAVPFDYQNLICADTVPIVPKETSRAVYIDNPRGEKILDFGQNLVGYVQLSVHAKAGQRIRLTHGEVLDGEGNFTTENFQASNKKRPVKQEVQYICKDGENSYRPTMTYMGFRYVKVEADFPIPADCFTAVAIYSDIPVTASFHCGNTLVNQLFSNSLMSMKGNFVDVPTDCPTREKSGYSGDAQTFVHTATYLMDCYPVYAKWLREQAATQYPDGTIAQVAPTNHNPMKKDTSDGGVGWSDSIEIVPYKLFERYADESCIRENYEVIRTWMRSQLERAKKTHLLNRRLLPPPLLEHMLDTGWMWGEWLEPGMKLLPTMLKLMLRGDPEVGTAYLYYSCKLTSEMAAQLGFADDAAWFSQEAEKARASYRALCLKNGFIKEKKRQCRYVRPLSMGLLDAEEQEQAAKRLSAMIRENGTHLNTGFLTTHELLRTLTRFGEVKTAYDLLLQEDAPGWLYAVKKGCTTIPEQWDCFDQNGNPTGSFNHYSYGAVSGWLIECCAGIRVENGKITIAPKPDERLGFVEAIYDSPFGTIASAWRYSGNTCSYHIEIPANTEAEILLPGREPLFVHAGSYDLS